MEQAERTGVTQTSATPPEQSPGRLTLARGARAILIPACYIAAAFIVTWHLWADPSRLVVAGNNNDQDIFLWFLRYSATAVSHGRLPALITTALNAPQGINVMTNTSVLLLGVLLAPVTIAFGPAATLTVLTAAGFAGSAGAMFWALRRWGASRGAAFLGGLVYGFGPAVVQSSTHIQIHFAVLPPLIIDAGLRLLVPAPVPGTEPPSRRLRRSARAGVWLGVLMAAQIFIGEEVLFLTAVAGALLAVGMAVRSRPVSRLRSWYRLQARYTAIALACSAGTVAVLAGFALYYQFLGPLPQRGYAFNPESFVNDLSSFVTPSGMMLIHTTSSANSAARMAGNPVEYLGYLGVPLLVALGAAMVVFWRNAAVRATAIAFVILAVFSLGGHLQYNGHEYWSVHLPWRLAQILIPPAQGTIPDRISIVADGAAAALLAFSLDEARARLASRWQVPELAALAALLVCVPLIPLPLPAANPAPMPAGWTTAFADLRLPPDARVLVVPTSDVFLTLSQAWQAESGQPGSIIGGYFIGPSSTGLTADGGENIPLTADYLVRLWALEVPAGSTYAADASFVQLLPGLGQAKQPSAAQVRADFSVMCPAAVVAVTVPGSGLARYLTQLVGPPAVRSGDVLAWRPSSLGIARWQQDCRSGPPRTFSAWPQAGK